MSIFLDQKQKRDNLTKFELTMYGVFSYGAAFLALFCFYVFTIVPTHQLQITVVFVMFVLSTISAVFGFAIKHDVRVLDLRRFEKN